VAAGDEPPPHAVASRPVKAVAASAGAHRGHDRRRLGLSFISGSFISGLLGLGTVRSQV
jgi:hypothetical protein